MASCENCFFVETVNNQFHCKLWSDTVYVTECGSFMPANLLCAVCRKRPIDWAVFLESGGEGFICDECERKLKYNTDYSALKVSELPLWRIHEIYINSLNENENVKTMNDVTRSKIVDTLSEKERHVYNMIRTFKGGVLIRSLDSHDRGCLGTLISNKLGEISSVIVNYRQMKMFKLTEE